MLFEGSKELVSCPKCHYPFAAKDSYHQCYTCKHCNWTSLENTLDINFKDSQSSFLDIKFPHKFTFESFAYKCNYECQSMQNFITSLNIPDAKLQKQFCKNYTGFYAWKLNFCLDGLKKDDLIYINGYKLNRFSTHYTELITTAFDCLYEQNDIFREICIKFALDKYLLQSTGENDPNKTLLTEKEFIFQMERLKERYKHDLNFKT